MKTDEKYITPESEEVNIKSEGNIATSCVGYSEGDLGCPSNTCPEDY